MGECSGEGRPVLLWDGRELVWGVYAWKNGPSLFPLSSVLGEKWLLLLRGSVGVLSRSSSVGGRGGDSTIELS